MAFENNLVHIVQVMISFSSKVARIIYFYLVQGDSSLLQLSTKVFYKKTKHLLTVWHTKVQRPLKIKKISSTAVTT